MTGSWRLLSQNYVMEMKRQEIERARSVSICIPFLAMIRKEKCRNDIQNDSHGLVADEDTCIAGRGSMLVPSVVGPRIWMEPPSKYCRHHGHRR